MSRVLKWIVPAVAFGLLLSVSGQQSRAAEEQKRGAGKVSGVVTKEDGKPAAGAMVRVMPPPPRGEGKPGGPERPDGPGPGAKPDGDRPPREQAAEEGKGEKGPKDRPDGPGAGGPRRNIKPIAEGKTDEEGKFELDVPAGRFLVIAGVRGQGIARERVEVKDGETVTVNLQLKPPPPERKRPE